VGKSLLLTLPEIILTLGSLFLLMMAAFAGDRLSRLATWIAVGFLAAAAFRPAGRDERRRCRFRWPLHRRQLRRVQQDPDLHRRRASLLAASGWFARDGVFKTEYPVLILLSSVGMGMMVSAGDLLTLYIGLELLSLSSYVLASFQRRDSRSAEAGLKYFVLGALASGILLYGVSLLYGFTGSTLFGEISVALGRDGVSTGELFGLGVRPRRHCLQDLGRARSTCGRRTYTKARRPRSPLSSLPPRKSPPCA
jgi:NADH-quinone oxidoreductase subunit N